MGHVLITGFKGCGKSTIGCALAHLRGMEWRDLDAALEDLYEQQTGQRLPFRQVFQAIGPEAFRQLEIDAAKHTAESARQSSPTVFSLGGGSMLQPAIRETLAPLGPVVYLLLDFTEIRRRMEKDGYPAFLKSDDKPAELMALYHQRHPQYQAVADIQVDITGLAPKEAAKRLDAALQEKEKQT